MKNKGLKITYWLSTCFVVFVGLAGILNVLQVESMVQAMRAVDLPVYMMPFLGTLKIVGSLTIAIPWLKRFQQPAYLGFIFYFIGATYVLVASGAGIEKWSVTLIILAAVVTSFATWQQLGEIKATAV